ncbi:MAG: ferrous iron transport protein A [Clostridia bacterium]|nr:ferrous iron transport protein A [Clostridia bacterium]
MKLSEAAVGSSCIVQKIENVGDFSVKLKSFGFIFGAKVSVVKKSAFSGALVVSASGCLYALRKEAAALIEVDIENTSRR